MSPHPRLLHRAVSPEALAQEASARPATRPPHPSPRGPSEEWSVRRDPPPGTLLPFRLRHTPVPSNTRREGARRALNIVVAALGLILTSPLMLLIAGWIRFSSPGPVLFRQTRVGLNRRGPAYPRRRVRRNDDLGGCPFTMYKFRTMRVEAENGRQVWASPDDDRVTPVGRILRRLRLDELPQLWNVLRGDMNVVGPRPEQPTIFVELRGQIEGYQERQQVRPGITGWAQINQAYDRTVDDVRRKLAFDLEYILRESTLQDVRIMLRTVPVMLGGRGSW